MQIQREETNWLKRDMDEVREKGEASSASDLALASFDGALGLICLKLVLMQSFDQDEGLDSRRSAEVQRQGSI